MVGDWDMPMIGSDLTEVLRLRPSSFFAVGGRGSPSPASRSKLTCVGEVTGSNVGDVSEKSRTAGGNGSAIVGRVVVW